MNLSQVARQLRRARRGGWVQGWREREEGDVEQLSIPLIENVGSTPATPSRAPAPSRPRVPPSAGPGTR